VLVSYRWLERHLDLAGISPQAVAEALTLSTAEVESLERFGTAWESVVVGRVLTKERHPNADRLSVCTVDVGAEAALTIVCGAPNVAAGQRVAVAKQGAVLPGGFSIKATTMRGVRSEGMICSQKELDLGDDDAGIWVLDERAPVGSSLGAALDLDDWVIEIDNKSLTHRPDLWGHRGIAAEIAAIFRRTLRPLPSALPKTGPGRPWPVALRSDKCLRYVALPIDNVRVLPSPLWLRALLLAVGQRPLNQIVDVSNFVMLDIGQPNHTFDAAALGGTAGGGEPVVVRDARAGERFTTLDGATHELLASDLLICAGERPVALAGVMGGAESRIADQTTSLLLESANFQPAPVRRTSARLSLRTDASARFEKTLDPTLAMDAVVRFVSVLQELQPQIALPAPPTDVGQWQRPPTILPVDPARIRADLGANVSDAEIHDILARLGFTLLDGGARVQVPTQRATKDITIPRDLVEEVGRIYRYGNIPEQPLPFVAVQRPDPRRKLQRAIEDRLASAAQFHEVRSYSFHSDELLKIVGADGEPHVLVSNPIAAGLARIRRTVLPSVLATLEPNRRLREEVRLFEIGKGYRPEQPNAKHEPREVHELALLLARKATPRSFANDPLRRLQGVIVDLVDHLGLGALQWSRAEAAPSWAHPVRRLQAVFAQGAAASDPVVVLAEVHPGVASALGLRGALASDVVAASVSIDGLLLGPKRERRFEPQPRFPNVALDVSVATSTGTAASAIERCILQTAAPLRASAVLFDLYEGESLGAGRKSLSYHVTLGAEDRTLSEAEVQKYLKRLDQALREAGGELRSG
jgi:phenylalanyl-tRNA synthetase beta chain